MGEFAFGYAVDLIRLAPAGRQEVEDWPAARVSLSASDVQKFLSLIQARADDADVPEPERGKARAAASPLRDLGVSVTSEMLSGWMKSQGMM